MTAITINELDEGLHSKLCAQAALHGCSVEQEAKDILAATLLEEAQPKCGKYKNSLLQAIRETVEPIGGIELELPSREVMTPSAQV